MAVRIEMRGTGPTRTIVYTRQERGEKLQRHVVRDVPREDVPKVLAELERATEPAPAPG